jgi:hypothetical protein
MIAHLDGKSITATGTMASPAHAEMIAHARTALQ